MTSFLVLLKCKLRYLFQAIPWHPGHWFLCTGTFPALFRASLCGDWAWQLARGWSCLTWSWLNVQHIVTGTCGMLQSVYTVNYRTVSLNIPWKI